MTSQDTQEYTGERSIFGRIPEVDQASMTFQIHVVNHQKLTLALPPQHRAAILSAFNGYTAGALVQLTGPASLDSDGTLRGFEIVRHVDVLAPLDVTARLGQLRELGDGWLDGAGKALDPAGLDRLAQAFERYYPDGLPYPYVYPTPEGGIQAEWTLPPHEISLEIDLADLRGEWHCLNQETHAERSSAFDLGEESGWRLLVDDLSRLAAGAA